MRILMILTMILLIISSISDIKKKEISILPVLIIVSIAFFYRGYNGGAENLCEEMIWRFIPGAVMFIISLVAHNSLGTGDAVIVLATGYILGAWVNLYMLLLGSVMGGVYGLVMLVLKKMNRNDSLPFVPFLLFGLIGVNICTGFDLI